MIDAVILAMEKACSYLGIADDVQVNSVLPSLVMTIRRRTCLEKWFPAHNISVGQELDLFPVEAGVSRLVSLRRLLN